VPAGAEVVDCSGATVTAGFWNSHVHLTERKWSDAANIPATDLSRQLEEFTRYGFTTVFDLSSSLQNTRALQERIDLGEVAGPRILTTGEGLIPLGGNPPELVSRVMGWMPVAPLEIAIATDAGNHIRQLSAGGADAIKIFASIGGSVLSEDVIVAVAECARAASMPVFVHPNTRDDVRRSVEARIDVLAHTVPRDGMAADDFAEIAAEGIALTPTLTLWHQMLRHDRASLRDTVVEAAVAQLRRFREGGGAVLFGTDHGAVDPDPAEEYRLMAEAGMGFPEILASLTTAPSRRFNDGRKGTVEAGEAADLVVLNGASSRGPAIFADVRLAIRAGRIIYPAL
jgi:imidazolonepropionase-like amidohydrolase